MDCNCSTRWEFMLREFTDKEFTQINKNPDCNYLIMMRDGEGLADLRGYIEMDRTMSDGEMQDIDGLDRATFFKADSLPHMYTDLFSQKGLFTERGIRSDILSDVAKCVGQPLGEGRDVFTLRNEYGNLFLQALGKERNRCKEMVDNTHNTFIIPKPWQKTVMTMIEKQDESVIMYVEAPRGAGKTHSSTMLVGVAMVR